MKTFERYVYTFMFIYLIIAWTWYAVELLTIKEIQTNGEDTITAIILAMALTFISQNKKIKKFINKKKEEVKHVE